MPKVLYTPQILVKGTYRRYGELNSQTDYEREPLALPSYLTTSEGHLWPIPKGMKGFYNSGGDFLARKFIMKPAFFSGHLEYPLTPTVMQSIDGSCSPKEHATGDWPVVSALPINLYGFSAAAFARTVPNKPLNQVANFIGELRDLPSLPFLRAMKEKALYFRNLHRNLGSEYLNYKFGWESFFRDTANITGEVLKKKKKLRQFLKDSGKIVRRRYSFDTIETAPMTTLIAAANYPAPATLWSRFVDPGPLVRVDTTKTEVWFSAAYRYYIQPTGQGWLSNIKRGEQIFNKMSGTSITPSVLWELAPWSWLADYFYNVGDIMKVLTAFSRDNLTAKYAYIMRKETLTRVYTLTCTTKTGQPLSTSAVCQTVKKQRARANPYGLSPATPLNGKQTAILAALGASRAPRR